MLGSEMSMGTQLQAGRFRIIAVAIQVYEIIKTQRAHLRDHYFSTRLDRSHIIMLYQIL